MSRCNYCSMEEIKKNRKKGEIIERKFNPPEMDPLGGVNIYKRLKTEKLNHDKHFISWFMELPDHCSC